MKVLKGIFFDPSFLESDMNGKECVAIRFGDFYHHATKADNGDYTRSHQGANNQAPMLKDGYVELLEKEERPEEESVKKGPLLGLTSFFGQEISKLSVEFK